MVALLLLLPLARGCSLFGSGHRRSRRSGSSNSSSSRRKNLHPGKIKGDTHNRRRSQQRKHPVVVFDRPPINVFDA
jgi:hypothetical protein